MIKLTEYDTNKEGQIGFDGFIDREDIEGTIVLTKAPYAQSRAIEAEDWEYEWSNYYPDFYIDGGRSFNSYYGDKRIADQIDWVYDDDEEISNHLSELTGKTYESFPLKGSVQREWVTLYAPEGIDSDLINWIESNYFNTGDEYLDEEDVSYYVPSDYNWSYEKTLEWLDKWYGFDKDSIVLKEKGYDDSVTESVKLGEDINPTQRKWGEKAYNLNRIISAMNNEDAYYGGWLYIWPDGEDLDMACYDFGTKSEYEELENSFKKYYKAYHKYGLYTPYDEVVDLAHEWDEKLGLNPIKNLYKGA